MAKSIPNALLYTHFGAHKDGLENISKYLSTGGSLGFLECEQGEIASTMILEEGEYAVVFVLKNAITTTCGPDMIISLIKDRNRKYNTVSKDHVVYVREAYANSIVTASGYADNIKISWGYIRSIEPQVVKEVHDRVTADKTFNELMMMHNSMETNCKQMKPAKVSGKKLDLSALESAITEKARVDNYPIAVGEISENSELPINMITDAKIIGAELGELLSCHPEYQQKLINIIAKTIKL